MYAYMYACIHIYIYIYIYIYECAYVKPVRTTSYDQSAPYVYIYVCVCVFCEHIQVNTDTCIRLVNIYIYISLTNRQKCAFCEHIRLIYSLGEHVQVSKRRKCV